MTSLTLKTVYPCCRGAARFAVVDVMLRERYQRQCAHCGTRWTVERNRQSSRPGMIIDMLDWYDHNTRLHRETFGI